MAVESLRCVVTVLLTNLSPTKVTSSFEANSDYFCGGPKKIVKAAARDFLALTFLTLFVLLFKHNTTKTPNK